MKNNLLLIGSAVWIGVAILFAFLVFLPSSSENFSFGPKNIIIKEESLSMKETERLVVSATMTKIEFSESSDDQLHVIQYDNTNTHSEFTAEKSGNSLLINLDDKRVIPFGIANKKLVIKLPKDWHGSLEAYNTSGEIRFLSDFELSEVLAECSSGGIHFEESLTVYSNADLHTTSGGIRLIGINSGDSLNFTTSSGGIRIGGDVEAKTIQVVTSSGGIQMESVFVNNFDFESSSGGITISKISGNGNMRANSGGIRVGISHDTGKINLRTSSGGIRVTAYGSFPLSFKADTSSGKISAFFELSYKNEKGNSAQGQTGTNPSTHVECRASSGGVDISERN